MVVSITGDGCFLMSAMELTTAARAGLPVRFFVFDDGTYHYMQMLQEPVYRRTTATEIARINYAAFAAGVGLAYNEILYREMAFDPDKDLDPICLYAFQPNVLVVNPALPVKSVAELIVYAKAHPHQLNYASGGVGSTISLAMQVQR